MKVHHKVYVEADNTPGTWSVTEYTFDENGMTINEKTHGRELSYKVAHDLKREILECYK